MLTPDEYESATDEIAELEAALDFLDLLDYLESEGFIEIEGERVYPVAGVEVCLPS